MLGATSKLLGALVGLGSLALLANACGEDCTVSKTCSGAVADSGSSGGEGGVDSGGDVVQPPAGCDAAADPKDAPACVVDGYGVFVDATSGNDANAGTKALPVKTITAAIGKVGNKPRVYVCEGTYAEHVKLTSAVSLYGGFACGAWNYTGTKAKVAPSDAGFALEVNKVSNALTIADLSFTAVVGTASSPSSIAAFVNASPTIALKRVALEAKAGAKGQDEAKAVAGALMSSVPTAGTLNGNSGGATIGGLAQTCTCVGGGTTKGGGGGNDDANGSPGETAQATPQPPTATGAGQTSMDCGTAGPAAKIGSNAPAGAPAAGATTLGTLAEIGWTPSPGSDATAGTPGQGGGGGGGGGGGATAGGGGSGACGGCGGEGGKGGGGGGASVALIALNSAVSLGQCALTTADAGAGGAGGTGGDGLAGGTRGNGGGAACNGGNGGKGGNGGGGGGGAGGVSVGVLYMGAKATLDTATKVTTGAFGTKGVGAGLDGIDGQKADTLEAL